MIDSLKLAQQLIRCPSVTPYDEGAIDTLEQALTELGFTCHRLVFQAPSTPPIENLYAEIGTSGPHFCFAGHTDVVPPGPNWAPPPFSGEVLDGYLHGRGAADMKTAIACFIGALSHYLKEQPLKGRISLLITGDEEGPAINGTRKVIQWLKDRDIKFEFCLIGEPSHPNHMGEMIKNGARGSLNTILTVNGVQGHVARPQEADNPLPRLIRTLLSLKDHCLDQGNDYFSASNLEITSIDVGNNATNVIPNHASARFNIRFNDIHTSASLISWIKKVCEDHAGDHQLEFDASGESFITKPGALTDLLQKACHTVLGTTPGLTTLGGTSDGRFIQELCPTLEFGMPMTTMHQVNERVRVKDIATLEAIYLETLREFFTAF